MIKLPHWPTFVWVAVLVVGAFVVYHVALRRR